jgi:hypothetical protein
MKRYIQIPHFDKAPSAEFVIGCRPDSVMLPAKGKRVVIAGLLAQPPRSQMSSFYPAIRTADYTAEFTQEGQILGISNGSCRPVDRAGSKLECVGHIRQRIPSASNMQAAKKEKRTIDTTKRFL